MVLATRQREELLHWKERYFAHEVVTVQQPLPESESITVCVRLYKAASYIDSELPDFTLFTCHLFAFSHGT